MIGKTNAGGGINTKDATASANMIAYGQTAYVNGEKVTGTLGTVKTGYISNSDGVAFGYESGRARIFKNYLVAGGYLYDKDTFTRTSINYTYRGWVTNSSTTLQWYTHANNNAYLLYYIGGYTYNSTNSSGYTYLSLEYNRYTYAVDENNTGSVKYLGSVTSAYLNALSDSTGAYLSGGAYLYNYSGANYSWRTDSSGYKIDNNLTVSSGLQLNGTYISLVADDNNVYSAGGYNYQYYSTNSDSNPSEYCYNYAKCFDKQTGTTTTMTALTTNSCLMSSIISKGNIIFAGGQRDYKSAYSYHNRVDLNTVYCYSSSLTQSTLPSLSVAKNQFAIAGEESGAFLCIGNKHIDIYDDEYVHTYQDLSSLSNSGGATYLNGTYYTSNGYTLDHCQYIDVPQSYIKIKNV